MLEDRITPSLYIVDALTDTGVGSGNSGDVLYCMTQANANGTSSDNTILFGVSGLISLTATLPNIANNLTITVPDNSAAIINGNSLGSVLTINSDETVSITGLTITGGSAPEGGGIFNQGALTISNCSITGNSTIPDISTGGGIYSNGTLAVNNCTVSGNSGGFGGGIGNFGTMVISNSTFLDNSSSLNGGGVSNGGVLTVSNCTFTDNYAGGEGGGIESYGTAVISNSTLTNNSGQFGGGGGYNDGIMAVINCTISGNSGLGGGGIYQFPLDGAALTLHDTIVAGNMALEGATNPDVAGTVSSSVTIGSVTYTEGYNLIGDGTGSSGLTNGVNGDQVGTSSSPIDPELGSLQNNGGPTPTMALLGNSPAINAGDPDTSGLPEYDQRGPGFPRIVGGRVDIGAYESSFLVGPAALISTYSGNNQNGTINQAYGTDLAVLVTDLNGNPSSGVQVTFTAPGSGASGTFAGNMTTVTVTTNAAGIAIAPAFTANSTTGNVSIAVSAGALSTSFSLTNANPNQGGMFTITSLADSDPNGGGVGSGTSGDLRYVLNQADNAGGNDIITFMAGLSGTIGLAATLPNISTNLTLTGLGANTVTVNGNSLGSVFSIDAGETVSITGLTIAGGSAYQGGGIYSQGALTVSNTTLYGNFASFGGGGIFNDGGTLTIANCTVSGNSANSFGGGVYNNGGTSTIANCTVSDNNVLIYDIGGGLFNYNGTLTASDCTISGNSAIGSSFGGGIGNYSGNMTVSRCDIFDNTASGGGGIFNTRTGIVTVDNSSFLDNTATGGGGGGMENDGTLTVNNSTLSGNYAMENGGGIASGSTLVLSNSTLSGNSSNGLGGGMENDGSAAILNCTISGNSVSGSYSQGGGIWLDTLLYPEVTTTLHDSIVAGNSALNGAIDPDVSGTFSTSATIGGVTYSEGYNLIGDGTGSSGLTNGVNGDQVGTSANPINPELGSLQNNGGPTPTMALLGNSPAINAGDPDTSGLPECDQRGPGFSRIVGSRVDIGAYEYQTVVYGTPTNLMVVAGSGQSTTVGSRFATPLQVLVTDRLGNPVPNQLVTFTVPTAGPSGLFTSPATVLTNAQGIATAPPLIANHLLGSFSVQASVAGVATTASFNLTVTAVPVAIVVSSGSGQKAQVNTDFASPLQARVTGANKQPIAGITVVFEVPSSGTGAFAAGPVAAVTNANGIATSPVLIANTEAGSFIVLASVAGVATQAKFILTNTAAAAASVSVLNGSPQSAAIGKNYAKLLQAQVLDSYGNPVSGVKVTFTAPSTGASGTFAHKSTVTAITAANGIATAPAFTANTQAGSFAVLASISGIDTPASFSLSNVSKVPARVKADGGTPQSATVGQTFSTALQVLVTNSLGQAVSGVWVTFSAPTSGASGEFNGSSSYSVQTNASGIAIAPTLTANTVAGKFNLIATVSGVAGGIAFSLTNLPGSPTNITVAAGSGQSTGLGRDFLVPLVALVTDAFGNVISGVTVTFTVQPNDDAGGTFSGNQATVNVTTSAHGLAIAPVLKANDTSGTFTVDASVVGAISDALFTLTNV